MKHFIFSLTCFLLVSSCYSQAEWVITDYSGQKTIKSGTSFYLKVKENGYHLAYKNRNYGINLGWGKTAKPNIVFTSESGGDIKAGDKVALKVAGGGFVKYEKRKYGINLGWSKEPVYEWEIRNIQNKKGDKLLSETNLGLLNTTAGDFVVYCERTGMPVVNLAWLSDCHGGSRLPGVINKVLSKDQLEKIIKYVAPLML